ncbi:MAG TPA: hypothetical protein VFC63_00245 [Blastocatellia bacterium]|nr:hypothetical protein [Blastocatellia bacterium]
MRNSERCSYATVNPQTGEASLLPYLPITLSLLDQTIDVSGLLDTGAAVNVLPYSVGMNIGAVWSANSQAIKLTGNLANFDARPLVVAAAVGEFSPVKPAFAWTRAEDIPVILGQINFFIESDVCFYRSQQAFEIRTRI